MIVLLLLGLTLGGLVVCVLLVAWRRASTPAPVTQVPWAHVPVADGISIYEVRGEDASGEWTETSVGEPEVPAALDPATASKKRKRTTKVAVPA
jgi:hypothetical protein